MRLQLRGKLSLDGPEGPVLTDVAADLLEQISAIGCLVDAAKRLGISYRHAWSLIQKANARTGKTLVEFRTGGKSGGGATLTEAGQALLGSFRDTQLRMQAVLDECQPLLLRSLDAAGSPADLEDQ